ncbi:DUF3078 domain-containing protein [Solitalea koreensis]|uniref:DUF3078 domain-containing protein n=1 Tax=Solitalea koreensis TaxID=543615 RepID=A0A521EBU9_9SPHI|nr:DUF3078 domain-containing protein [Solitalea koreensis]SMO81387.1 Protein of unknown function [Solitalea koreensis]
MRSFFTIVTFFLFYTTAFAQKKDSIKVWTIGGSNSFLFSQASFSNWKAGGQSSLNFLTGFSGHANRHKPKNDWENTVQAAIGTQWLEDETLRKTDDRFEIVSKYGIRASDKLYTSFQLNLRSQFVQGFQYSGDKKTKASNFFAPAYLTLSSGMDYRPFTGMSLLISPFSTRATMVLDQDLANLGAYGVKAAIKDADGSIVVPGQRFRQQIGMGGTIRFDGKLMQNVKLTTKLDLFAQYDYLDVFDVNWDCLFDFKINRYLTANIGTSLIYDEDILIKKTQTINGKLVETNKPHVQFKEILSLGLKFNY